MTKENQTEGRFSRWSKRKLSQDKSKENEENSPQILLSEDEGPTPQELAHAQMLEDNRQAAQAVDIESLDGDSDFKLFLKEGVPEALKRKALSKLWRSNPILGHVDGLLDYDDDFASPDLIMPVFQSAWQAGRGYLKEILDDENETSVVGEGADGDILCKNQAHLDEEAISEDETPVELDEISAPEQVQVEALETASNENLENSEDATPIPKISLRRRLMLDQ